jgi:hypothetical protein
VNGVPTPSDAEFAVILRVALASVIVIAEEVAAAKSESAAIVAVMLQEPEDAIAVRVTVPELVVI